jgi:hypothetical protein
MVKSLETYRSAVSAGSETRAERESRGLLWKYYFIHCPTENQHPSLRRLYTVDSRL